MSAYLLPDGRLRIFLRAETEPDENGRYAIGDGAIDIGPDDPRYAELLPNAVPAPVYRSNPGYIDRMLRLGALYDKAEGGHRGFENTPEADRLTESTSVVSEPLAQVLHGLCGEDATFGDRLFAEDAVTREPTLDWFVDELRHAVDSGALTPEEFGRLTGAGADDPRAAMIHLLERLEAARNRREQPT